MKTLHFKLAISFLFFVSLQLTAANYYWVGGSGDWTQYNLHWATSSGGQVFHNQVPTTNDDVIFDANSFTAANQSVTLDNGTFYCHSMIWTGVQFNPTIITNTAFNSFLVINGSLLTSGGMTWMYSAYVHFNSNLTGNTISAPSGSLGRVRFIGTGEWVLQSAFLCQELSLEAGTLRTNNFSVSSYYDFAANSSATKSLILGTSVVSASNEINFNSATTTIDADSSVLICGSLRSFSGQVYNRIEFNNTTFNDLVASGCSFKYIRTATMAVGNTFVIAGSNNHIDSLIVRRIGTISSSTLGYVELLENTFFSGPCSIGTLFLNNPNKFVKFHAGSTTIITNTIQSPTSCLDGYVTVSSTVAGVQAVLSKASGTINCNFLSLQDINATGGATFNGNNSVLISNVTGWNVNSSSRTLYWVGGAGNWSDAGHWSVTSGGAGGNCMPSAIDNVIFDASSFYASGAQVILDVDGNCNNMTWTNVQFQPAFYNTNTSRQLAVYSNFTLCAGMTWNCSGTLRMISSNPNKTLDPHGISLSSSNVQFVGGTTGSWILQDSIYCKQFEVNSGTFRSNDKLIRVITEVNLTSSNNKSAYFGTSYIDCQQWSAPVGNLILDVDSCTISCENFSSGPNYIYRDIIFSTHQNQYSIAGLQGAQCQYRNVIFNIPGAISSDFASYKYVLFKSSGTIYGHYNNFVKFEVRRDFTAGANNFDTLYLNNPGYVVTFNAGQVQTINKAIISSGSCSAGNVIIRSSQSGLQAIISKASGTISCNQVTLQDVNATGGATFIATNSINSGNVTGWTFSSVATPRTLYWVGGTGNWNDAAHWSIASGGTGGQCPPNSTDDVIFDNLSFPGNNTISVNVPAASCKNMSWLSMTHTPQIVNTYPQSVNQPGEISIFGSILLNSQVQWNYNGNLIFTGSSQGNTVNTLGKQLADVYFNGQGARWVLADVLNAGNITLNAGTLFTSGYSVNVSDNFQITGDTLRLGSSVVTAQYLINNLSPGAFDAGTSTVGSSWFESTDHTYHNLNMNVAVFPSVFKSNNCTYQSAQFSSLGVDFYNCTNNTFNDAVFNGPATIRGITTFGKADFRDDLIMHDSASFDTLYFNNPAKTVQLKENVTYAINNEFYANGLPGSPITIKSLVNGVQANISKTADTACLEYLSLRDINATGGAVFYAGINSNNLGNSTGWIFSSCVLPFSDVWPGDVNFDLTVDNLDALYLGIAYGTSSHIRSGASLSWTGQSCLDWPYIFTNMVNLKNADCNGDGTVDSLDLDAITLNYGMNRPPMAPPQRIQQNSLSTGVPLYFQPANLHFDQGDTVEIPFYLGNSTALATNVYGIATDLNYDNARIVSGSEELNLGNSWLTPLNNHLEFIYNNATNGRIEFSDTRIDRQNTSGQGQIGIFRFVIDSNATDSIQLNFSNIHLLDINQNEIAVNAMPVTVYINQSAPVVAFTATPAIVCPGNSISFTDQSSNTPSSWSWAFAGGNPSSSTLQNPSVTYTTPGVYSVSLTAGNAYGTTTGLLHYITVGLPIGPGAISGPTSNICSSTAAYAVPVLNGATSYTWSLPSGMTITSGQGTANITVSVGGTFTSGTISVIGTNSCATSPPSTLAVTKSPAAPGPISGPASSICTTTATYSVSPVAGATSYTWAIPAGFSITSGQGTNSLTVSILSTFVSGNLTVKANNACASSPVTSLSIIRTPAMPGPISGPSSNICGTTATYTVAPVSGAATYVWTVPAGMSIVSGQSTNTLNVSFASNYAYGSLTVKAVSSCSLSSAIQSLLVVKVPATPTAISGPTTNICASSATYSTTAVTGASTYLWTVPANATIVSGQGTTSINVNFASGFTSGNVTVSAGSTCPLYSPVRSLAISRTAITPGVIYGPATNVCASTANYSIAAVAGAVSYNWTVPANMSITSGQGTTSIQVAIASGFTSGNIYVTANNGCSNSGARTLAVSKLMATPGAIYGPATNVCATTANYSIAALTGAVSYTWTVPPNMSITSGQGTTSIQVAIASGFTSGNISVTAYNGCNTSAARVQAVSRTTATPGAIFGPATNVCVSTANYSVAAVAGAVSYSWTVPPNVSITSGQGTNSIQVAIASGFTSGNISVIANNGCTNSAASTLAVSRTTPTPGTIYGPSTNVCVTSANYSIVAVSGAVSYNWTVPANMSITSGQGTTSIQVAIASGFTAGTISVTANNGCTNSTARTLAVSRTTLTPGVISGPTTNVCASTASYSIAAVAGAVSYTWTAPANASITSGQGTTTIQVAFASGFVSGSFSVTATNGCTNSAVRTLSVSRTTATPGVISGPSVNVCASTATYSIAAVSGAVNYTWTVPANMSIISGQGTTSIQVSIASGFISGNLLVRASNGCTLSGARSLAISRTTAQSGVISGPSTNLCASTATYSVPLVSGMTYTWTVPANISITSGQGTNSINVSIAPAFTSGTLSVIASNGCTNSTARTLALSRNVALPGLISGQTTSLCGLLGVPYSVVNDPGATYTWTVPADAVITAGQGTNSIVVDFGDTITSGFITVYASNACSNSGVRSLSLADCICNSCVRIFNPNLEGANDALSISDIYPNPATNKFFLDIESDGNCVIQMEIVDAQGKLISSEQKTLTQGINVISNSIELESKGIYLVRIINSSGKSITKRVLIQ